MAPIRILLADDHTVLRAGLIVLLGAQPDMEVVGDVEDGRQALDMAVKLKPDVVLADIGMPGLNGLQLASRLRKAASEARVIILTVHEDQSFVRQALKAGAAGYLVKHAAEAELLAGIRAVARGEAYLMPSLTKSLIEDYVQRTARGPAKRPSPSADDYDGLTPREVEVLRCIAQGYSNAQTAEKLVISIKTVESHRAHIVEKLGRRSRVELVRYAVEKGLLE